MKNYLLAFLCLSFLASSVSAQFDYGCNGERYVLPLFTEIGEDLVKYGRNAEPDGDSIDLFMNVFYPQNDEQTDARPTVILAHGGSFVGGDKDDMDVYCERLAELGYVAATIDYRLLSLFSGVPDSLEAMDIAVKASHDMKAAIRWFKHSAIDGDNPYNIDSEMIFIGGYSAGAITALLTGILDEEEIEQDFLIDILEENAGFEGNSGDPAHLIYDTEIRGILNLSGAVYDTSWIDAGDPIIQSFHGDADETVPYAYDFVYFLTSPIIKLHGSSEIYMRTENLEKPGYLYTVPGGGHGDIYFFANFENDRSIFTGVSDTSFAEIICGILVDTYMEQQFDLQIYPNPAQERLFVQGIDERTDIRLFDLQGRLLSQKILQDSGYLNLEEYPEGIYYYRASSGKKLTAGSFVIAR